MRVMVCPGNKKALKHTPQGRFRCSRMFAMVPRPLTLANDDAHSLRCANHDADQDEGRPRHAGTPRKGSCCMYFRRPGGGCQFGPPALSLSHLRQLAIVGISISDGVCG